MEKAFESNADESIRLFENGLLESLTKVHPLTPVVIFGPVVIYFLWDSLVHRQMTLGAIGATYIGGLLFWTFFEYFLHRFIFHYEPKNSFGRKIHYLFHGIHHAYPRDSRRLVMPPTVSIPLATSVYFALGKFLSPAILPPFFSAFILGYLFYDLSHFAIHHYNIKWNWWQAIKMHHLRHHYSNKDKSFGVSSPLWDVILKS